MNKSAFRQRYENWKNGLKVYDAGKVIEKPNSPEEKQHEDAALLAALKYAIAVKLDKFDSGKDAVAGGYNFNAIKQVSDEAPLSYGSYYDLTGDYKMDGIFASGSLAKYNTGKDGAKDIYDKLRNLGFDHNSALGILGNAMQESSMNPDSVSKSKNYHGLLQNSTAIRNAVHDMYGGYGIDQQLQYVSDWADAKKNITKGKHSKHVATYAGKYKKSGYKTPEEAADAFMRYYERPVILDNFGKVIGYQHRDKRINYAKRYSNQIKDQIAMPDSNQEIVYEDPRNTNTEPAVSTNAITPVVNPNIIQAQLKEILPHISETETDKPFIPIATPKLQTPIDLIENYNRFWNEDVPVLQMPR